MHRISIAFICILFSFTQLQAQFRATETISDSIDLQHISIKLNVTDYAGKTIQGEATIYFTALVDNIHILPLDLLALETDSVQTTDGDAIVFTQSGEKLNITLPAMLNSGQSDTVRIFYSGVPEQDGSWGGWYWSGDYSYQLGVGFDAIPHNYGRVWFPCFDNFVERSTYDFAITTPSEKKAFCGGLATGDELNADGTRTWLYDLQQSIPSYLASVAVANYATVNMVYHGVERDIPIQIGVKAADSTNLKNSFINLQGALQAFEEHYGPYAWDRVGYSIVPFSGGAMEHAMNIAYPLFAITGGTEYENLYVHELSHHWWGDLVTCRTAEEMWINEGWASYSEFLFDEYLYGAEAYAQDVESNHAFVLQYAAANDGNNYFALSHMPAEFTYGSTTYKKGADVISTLRSYMGDEMFFSCIQNFLSTHAFTDVSAEEIRDSFSACSGIDLTSFFDNWIFNSGFASFEIEDYGYTDYSTVNSICIEQKLKHAPAYFEDVPLTISFFDDHWNKYFTQQIVMHGEHASFSLPDISRPYAAIIDYDEKISDAVTADEIVMHTTGDYFLPHAFATISPSVITDSAIIYAEQYWTAADHFRTVVPGLHINTQRYWKFQGLLPATFEASAILKYNGKQGVSGGNQDDEFIDVVEDSLVLLYRAGINDDWTIYPYYILNDFGPNNDKFGQFELSKFSLGEYAIGKYDHSIANDIADTLYNCPDDVSIEDGKTSGMLIYPNPANTYVSVDMHNIQNVSSVCVYDSTGKMIKLISLNGSNMLTIPLQDIAPGIFEIKCTSVDNTVLASQKLVIIR